MDVIRSAMPLVVGLGFIIIGLKMASTGSTGLMHSYHLVGVLPQDRERLGRSVGRCMAVTGSGALLSGACLLIRRGEVCALLVTLGAMVSLVGIVAGVVAVLYFQFVRPRSFWRDRGQ